MKLRKNLCFVDRVVRLSVGILCVYVGFIETSVIANDIASVLIGLFGAINLFAFSTSYCPVYGVTGLSTLEKNNQ